MNFEKSADVVPEKDLKDAALSREDVQEADRFSVEAQNIINQKKESEADKRGAEEGIIKEIASLADSKIESPENLKNKIDFYQQIVDDWKSVTSIIMSDTGLGRFNLGSTMSELAKRYPGVEVIMRQLKTAEEKNRGRGFLRLKPAELDDVSARAIKNYLTTGSVGRFTNKEMEVKVLEKVQDFLTANKLTEDDGVENYPQNLAQAILGDKDVNFYKSEIEKLTEKVEQLKKAV